MWFEAQQPGRIWEHGLRIRLREALAAQEVKKDLRMTPAHVSICSPSVGR
jgi:hypothetical protein